MDRQFLPRDVTVADLEQKAAECEEKASSEKEPRATELRDEAILYRSWVAALRSGQWTSLVGLGSLDEFMTQITSDRGSTFYLCGKSATDPNFPKYPRLPVIRCLGYEKKS